MRLRSPIVRDAPIEQITTLDDSTRAFSTGSIRLLYASVLVVAAALLYVNVTTPSDWQVDTTSLVLVGIVCALPLIDRLRKLKVGNVEFELAEIRSNLEAVQRDAAAANAELADERAEEDDELALPENADEGNYARTPIDRIVWVDDRPADNRAYVTELAKRFTVALASTTTDGVALVAQAPERTLVITDSARVEGSSLNVGAGRELLESLRREYPGVPAVVFASDTTIANYGGSFLDAGAVDATGAFADLAEIVTRIARRRFRAAVADVMTRAGGHAVSRKQSHWIVTTSDGRTLYVEARDWRRRPTAPAVDRVWRRAQQVLTERTADEVVVVVPVNRLSSAQLERAPDAVEVVTLDQLPAVLDTV
jgi:DNA-binding NarL/FixJ family response regulator